MDYLKEIAKHHNDWIRSVKAYGEIQYSEDIVQEMYYQIVKYRSESKAFKDGVFNKNYIFRTLFNMTYSFKKSKNNLKKVSIGDGFELVDEGVDLEHLDNLQRLDDAIDKLPWYSKKLVELHCKEGIPIREIGRDSGLGYSSISRTITKAKETLKKEVYG